MTRNFYERWSNPLVSWWLDLSDRGRATLEAIHGTSGLVVRDLRTGDTYGGTIDVWPVAEALAAKHEAEDEVLDLEELYEQPAAADDNRATNDWLRNLIRNGRNKK